MSENKLIRFDWFIKKMLRDKSDYKVLEGFLTALLKKDIQILNILESEGNQDKEDSKFNRVYILVEDNNNIFPEYYIINVEKFPEIVKEDIDEWIYMLKTSETKKEFKSKYIDIAREKLKYEDLSDQEKRNYERHVMDIVRERDIMETAKDEGREEEKEQSRLKNVEMVFKLLTKKFKVLDDKLEEKIKAADSTKLEHIIEEILDIEDLAFVERIIN